HVLQRQREREDGLAHLELARLDALGDDDLVHAGEQGDAAHLLEVHANRVGRVTQERRAIFALFFFLRDFRNPLFVLFLFRLGKRTVLGGFNGDLTVAIAVAAQRDHTADLFGRPGVATELFALARWN